MERDRGRDPERAMLLFGAVVNDSLDPSYRLESERDKPRKTGRFRSLLLFLSLVALSWGATTAAKTLRVQETETGSASAQIQEQVVSSRTVIADLENQIANLSAQVETSETSQQIASSLSEDLAFAAATTDLTGPGVVITVTDGPPADASNSHLVHDVDLRFITNALWSAGAEGIAVDENRLGAPTSIRTAGASILVNLNPVTSPYQIEAIGNPERLLTVLEEGYVGAQLLELEESTGIELSVARSEEISLPALSLPSASLAVPSE